MLNKIRIKNMKRIILMLTLAVSLFTANAQQVTEEKTAAVQT